MKGDIDQNCVVDIADVVLFQRWLQGETTLSSAQLTNADVAPVTIPAPPGAPSSNPDGVSDVEDLVVIQRLVAGDFVLPGAPPTWPTLSFGGSEPTHDNPATVNFSVPVAQGQTATLAFTVNGRVLPDTKSVPGVAGGTATGSFNMVMLFDGENSITATSTVNGEKSCPSDPRIVTYENDRIRSGSSGALGDTLLTSPMALTPGESPGLTGDYIVDANFAIGTNGILILQPGTVLRFGSGVGLELSHDGELRVQGEPGKEVVFTSTSSQVPGAWPGIGRGPEAPWQASASATIQHAVIEYAHTGIKVGGEASISHVAIHHFSSIGMWFAPQDHEVTVSHVTIDNRPDPTTDPNVDPPNPIDLDGDGMYGGGPGVSVSSSVIRGTDVGYHSRGASPTISSTTIEYNGVGVHFDGDGGPGSSQPKLINGNRVRYNFDDGIVVTGSSAAVPQISINPTIAWNTIADNADKNLVAADNFLTQIVAENNWWGTAIPTGSGSIDAKIDDTETAVDWDPFLDGEDGQAISSGYLTGSVAGSVTLQTGQTYQILGTYSVDAGDALTIDAGATLKFVDDAELRVTSSGVLSIEGTLEDPVVLTSIDPAATPGSWNGLRIDGTGVSTVDHTRIEFAKTGIHVSASDTSITNTEIFDFELVGIDVDAFLTGIELDANTIDNREERLDPEGGGFVPPTKSEILADTLGTGIRVGEGTTGSVAGSIVRGTYAGIELIEAPAGWLVQGSILEFNRTGLKVREDTQSVIDSENFIEINNVGVDVTGGDQFPSIFSPAPIITGNTIAGNYDWNYFAGVNGGAVDLLEAEGNYWGTTDPVAIAAKIHDRLDASSSPLVDYGPFSNAGGVLQTQFLLDDVVDVPTGQSVTILGPVEVPLGQTWSIGSGATVHVDPGHTIEVYGTLDVNGASGQEVLFQSSKGVKAAGDWQGIVLHPTSSGSTFDFVDIQHAVRGIEATDADFVLRDSLIRYFSEAGLYLDGATAATDLHRNHIDNYGEVATFNPGTRTGIGVWLVDASPELFGNDIQDLDIGIRVTGSSQPRIDGSTADGPNLIHHNTHGISLEGTVDGVVAANPDLIQFHQNQLYNNDTSNLRLDFTPGAGRQIDASANYWGVTTEAEIRATILNVDDASPGSVDFSGYLDQNMEPEGDAGLFSSLISGVGFDDRIFWPTLEGPVSINFTLAAPATVTLRVFPETLEDSELSTAPPTRTLLTSSSLAAGPHSIVWDGKNTENQRVPDEAYVFHLEASNGSLSESFFPTRPTPPPNQGVGQFHGPLSSTYDPRINDFVLVNYDLAFDGRVEVRIDPDEQGQLPSFQTASMPLLAGSEYLYLFDGRFPSGHATPFQIIDGKIRVTFPVPKMLRPNFVIVDRTSPEVKGPELEANPVPHFPRIEVRPDPYLITHSYNQLSRIRFCVDQPSDVKVKILPFGNVTPNPGTAPASEITVFDNAVVGGTTCSEVTATLVEFYLPDLGGTQAVDVLGDGPHTFTIEARSQADATFTTLYRGVIHQRR